MLNAIRYFSIQRENENMKQSGLNIRVVFKCESGLYMKSYCIAAITNSLKAVSFECLVLLS